MHTISLQSPAKINLFLRILGKRSDGFHEIASLMQAINLMDKLTLTFADSDTLICNDPNIPVDQSNLIFKAAEVFREKIKKPFHLNVQLEKNIPSQAGLGGGSSNAATTLWGLNALLNFPFNEEELCELAGKIGSDVAFFLSKGTGYCTGRGEKLLNLPELMKQNLWVLLPNFGLSTPEVYKKFKLIDSEEIDPIELIESFYSKNTALCNDLEKSAFSIRPELKKIKKDVIKQGYDSLMSGSGSSLFCLGRKDPPILENGLEEIRVLPATFIRRKEGAWY